MKKIYMILFALMAVLNASAKDYYLVGNTPGWDASDTYKFTESANTGVYTLTINGSLASGFKINNGDWTGDNIGSNGNALVVGTAYTYSNDGSSGNINYEDELWTVTNPTLTLNITDGTLLVEGTVVKPTTVTYTYGIKGSFENGKDWAETMMTEGSDGVFTVTIEAKVDAAFGFNKYANGTYSEWWAASEEVTISGDTEITLANSNTKNINIAAGTYDFSLDTTTKKLTVKKSTASAISSIAAESEADAPAYNVAGQRVAKGAKGLVIVNGKKFFNK